ncbi:hypothetical protein [Bradyrhizobium sp. 174]|uniref:hypothetical protein n=1 Tax=Bradyrhizobium sp. 174 TaxID=2782645 RepID=UPI001FF8B3D0|nr:hypothetical protein [Bradyrhizobium sp. 174]MCK1574629.1 hypothetical protein [Bradyrhizobium sp. 174]
MLETVRYSVSAPFMRPRGLAADRSARGTLDLDRGGRESLAKNGYFVASAKTL